MVESFHISLTELSRLAPDALRGAGFPFPRVERSSHMLVWGEAVHHMGLRFLNVHHERIRASLEKKYVFADGDFNSVIIDGHGKSVLEIGPRVIDVSNAAGTCEGVGVVVVRNTFGLFLLGEALTHAARRGLAIVILYKGGSSSSVDEFEGSGVLAQFPAALDSMSIDQRLNLLGGTKASGAVQFASDFLERNQNDAPHLSSFALISIALPSNSSNPSIEALPADAEREWCRTTNFEQRWQEAMMLGLSTTRGDWDGFTMLLHRMRVPTSERSQQQAG
jgi:hypothetical protein